MQEKRAEDESPVIVPHEAKCRQVMQQIERGADRIRSGDGDVGD